MIGVEMTGKKTSDILGSYVKVGNVIEYQEVVVKKSPPFIYQPDTEAQ